MEMHTSLKVLINQSQSLIEEASEQVPFSKTIKSLQMGLIRPQDLDGLKDVLKDLPTIKAFLERSEGPCVIIPLSESIFIMNLDPEAGILQRYMFYPQGTSVIMGNPYVSGPCAMVMDPCDFPVFMEHGINAVYTNAKGLDLMIENFRCKIPEGRLVIIPPRNTPSDQEGMQAERAQVLEVSERIHKVGGGCSVFIFPEDLEYRGAYELNIRNARILEDLFRNIIESVEDEREQALFEYNRTSIGSGANSFKEFIFSDSRNKTIPTGFPQLDRALDGGFFEGLYVLGANSSLGKTSLTLQIADNISSYADVLFFSIEQSRYELMAKSISRLSFMGHSDLKGGEPFTSREIMSHVSDMQQYRKDLLMRCIDRYAEISGNLYIIEGDTSREISEDRIGMDTIRKALAYHIDVTGRRPVVFIDYLQIIYPSDDVNGRNPDKKNIDLIVSELRRIAKDQHIPIFLISSKNRASYTTSSDMGGFKESGIIEYSADVVMELVPEGMSGKDTSAGKSGDVELLKNTRSSEKRTMRLEIPKNRMGRTHRGIKLLYDARYNHFEEFPESSTNLHAYRMI